MMTVRAIGPADEAAYVELLAGTSNDDRYYRFFRAVDHFEHSDVARFVEPQSDVVGLIAFDDGRALGTAHAFMAGDRAEIAVIVAGDARRRGVGSALLAHLFASLGTARIRTVAALSLTDNYPFARLARRVGMTPSHAVGDGNVITWTLALGPAGQAVCAVAPAAAPLPPDRPIAA